MVNIKFKLVSNNITPSIKRIQNALSNVPKEAYEVFKSATPAQSGNARKRTRLLGNKIVADYPYATELDAGESQKAPEGMSKPTTDFITKRIDQIMRRK